MVVMAGGIDIHSHIAGGNVNNARLLMPEIHRNFVERNLKGRENLKSGHSRWTVDGTGYRYCEMGFTTVIEPAVPFKSVVNCRCLACITEPLGIDELLNPSILPSE